MKTAVIYARYSSDSQSEQSIDGQLRVCYDYAKNNNIVIIDTYIDRAMTGTNDARPDFQRMLKDSSKKAWDYVLVYKLDRFSRNKYEMAMHKKTLKDNGIKLISAMEYIPDSPEAILIESMLEGYAEYYSAELSQKVKRGMNESRQKGQFTGGNLLYGYRLENKKIFVDDDKAPIVNYIFEQYANGMYVEHIIEYLTSKGILNKGKPFAKSTIYGMLSNEKYIGITRHNDEVFTNIYPRIVSQSVFDIVRKKTDENHYGKHIRDVTYLLKSKMRCGLCGNTITSESGTARNGTIQRYYKCAGRKSKKSNCQLKPIKKDILERIIIETTLKSFKSQETINILADRLVNLHTQQEEDQSLCNTLEKEKNSIVSSINNLINCMEQGIITSSTKTRLIELESKLNTINKSIELEKSKNKLEITKEDIISFIKRYIKKGTEPFIKALIKEIVIYEDRIEIFYNYTDRKKDPDENNHQVFCFYKDEFKTSIDSHKFNTKNIEIKYDIFCLI